MSDQIEMELSALKRSMDVCMDLASTHIAQCKENQRLADHYLAEHRAVRERFQDLITLKRTGVFHA